ncbi:MAG TPA: acetyl-CoA C-acyltransferase, partial [Acidobacteriaceae bacterium]|nr:acetyl-CoA C-acyltransferase [Acidobacteriaceae bacterium]
MTDIAIISAVRTPVGKFQGALSDFSATDLGAMVVREAVSRAHLDPAQVDECIMGCVLPAGLGQNPARQAALRGGLNDRVAALTINMVCGSGLKAVALAAQSIAVGNADIVVAGGMESMTNAPYLLPNARKGLRMGDSTVVDSMVRDGLLCACDNQHMGMTAELVADKHSFTREQQDSYAVESHRRAAAATAEGRFTDEILPIILPTKKKGAPPTVLSTDESIRPDTTLEALSALRPAFKPEGGTVSAGN